LAQAFSASRLHQPQPGVVEEDPEVQLDSVCQTIRRCLKAARVDKAAVAGIGIDGQMAGSSASTPRAGTSRPTIPGSIPAVRLTSSKWSKRPASGSSPRPAARQFQSRSEETLVDAQRKSVYRTIAAFVQPGGYAVMRLCGLDGSRAFIDKTYLHFSAFADNRRSRWDGDLCRQFGFDEAKLPAIVDAAAIVGEVTADAARQCGLRPGVPVVAGCGDTVASFLACGAATEGWAWTWPARPRSSP